MQGPDAATVRQAARDNDTQVLSELLRAGAPADEPQHDGCTALWLAAEAGSASAVQLLLHAGASPAVVKPAGAVSAVYVAAQNGHTAVVRTLLAYGADLEVPKDSGATPLFIASQQGHADVVAELLRAGANPNMPTRAGMTPLMIAAHQGRRGTVELLLSAGADPNQAGGGKDLIQWAEADGGGAWLQRLLDSHRQRGRREDSAAFRAADRETDGSVAGLTEASAGRLTDGSRLTDADRSVSHLVQRLKREAASDARVMASGSVARPVSPRAGRRGGRSPADAYPLGDTTPGFVREERRRRAVFQQDHSQQQPAGVHWVDVARSTSGVRTAREWQDLKYAHAKLQEHFDSTRDHVQDAWMYAPAAVAARRVQLRSRSPVQGLIDRHALLSGTSLESAASQAA